MAPFSCELCSSECGSKQNLDQHIQGADHRSKQVVQYFKSDSPTKIAEISFKHNDVTISISMPLNTGNPHQYCSETSTLRCIYNMGSDKRTLHFDFIITNRSRDNVLLESNLLHQYNAQYQYIKKKAISWQPLKERKIASGKTIEVRLSLTPALKVGKLEAFPDFKFQRGSKCFYVSRRIKVKAQRVEEINDSLKPNPPYKSEPLKDNKHLAQAKGFAPPKPDTSMLEVDERIVKYELSIAAKARIQRIEEGLEGYGDKGAFGLDNLNAGNYKLHFHNMLYFEDNATEEEIKKYSMEMNDGSTGVEMELDTVRTDLVCLKVPGLADRRPEVMPYNKIYATVKRHLAHLGLADQRLEGIVHEVDRENCIVKLGFCDEMVAMLSRKVSLRPTFMIEFEVNKLPSELQHRAIDWAMDPDNSLYETIFPTGETADIDDFSCPVRYANPLIRSNERQQLAVNNIVKGICAPAPYILFGPPGTGKTVTIVESIYQLSQQEYGAKILVCAPQNHAADNVAEKLMKCVDKSKAFTILRLHALSRPYGSVRREIQGCSNFRRKAGVSEDFPKNHTQEAYLPDKETIQRYQIIVCTLCTAGRLASAGLMNHFSHVFIDEAGQGSEPECLIALAKLIDFDVEDGRNKLVVLAGDPKQLGPVIFSKVACRYKLSCSFLERLMTYSEPYKRDEDYAEYNRYNPDFITQLVKNFRNHESILTIPNKLFYEDELEACADPVGTDVFLDYNELQKKGFPMIFHHVAGLQEREGNNHSWYNVLEINEVIRYITEIMTLTDTPPHDIGIITPYHKQVTKIQKALEEYRTTHSDLRLPRDYFKSLMVGSPEKFQGQERSVIIISTVRSRDDNSSDNHGSKLGFLASPKRFNVAVTRAKALQIVVGNGNLLSRDKHWGGLLKYIKENGGYRTRSRAK